MKRVIQRKSVQYCYSKFFQKRAMQVRLKPYGKQMHRKASRKKGKYEHTERYSFAVLKSLGGLSTSLRKYRVLTTRIQKKYRRTIFVQRSSTNAEREKYHSKSPMRNFFTVLHSANLLHRLEKTPQDVCLWSQIHQATQSRRACKSICHRRRSSINRSKFAILENWWACTGLYWTWT